MPKLDKKILLREDDEMISEIYRRQLEKAGYMVEVVTETEQAIEKIKKEEPALVLMDLLISGGGGMEILKRLKDWKGKTKKVIFSNEQDNDLVQEAAVLGADGFWLKSNYTPSQLLAKVNEILA